jgi:hypothetical protein
VGKHTLLLLGQEVLGKTPPVEVVAELLELFGVLVVRSQIL